MNTEPTAIRCHSAADLAAQRRIEQRQRQQAHEAELRGAPDPQTAARITAWYRRETQGLIRIRDRTPHYLCDLGLSDVVKSRAPRLPPTTETDQ